MSVPQGRVDRLNECLAESFAPAASKAFQTARGSQHSARIISELDEVYAPGARGCDRSLEAAVCVDRRPFSLAHGRLAGRHGFNPTFDPGLGMLCHDLGLSQEPHE
jgi:hypothetical protein